MDPTNVKNWMIESTTAAFDARADDIKVLSSLLPKICYQQHPKKEYQKLEAQADKVKNDKGYL